MKLAIMQPYFCPYIGYFQLMNAVDKFVVYDNIQYTKKGWINRNRILTNGKDQVITLPLKKDSDYLNVNQRFLSDDFDGEKKKLLNKIRGSYLRAPNFSTVFPLIETLVNCEEKNLFDYIYFSIRSLKDFLNISTELIRSSTLEIDIEQYKSEEKVLAISESLGASTYINPIGGLALYNRGCFEKKGVELLFIKSNDIAYAQFNHDFVPWLSIIDVLMFNSAEKVVSFLNEFEYI